jgi:hypothetical protein
MLSSSSLTPSARAPVSREKVDLVGENVDLVGENVDRVGENVDRVGEGAYDSLRSTSTSSDKPVGSDPLVTPAKDRVKCWDRVGDLGIRR